MVITKYSLIGAILQAYPSAEACFNEMGMHCVSCHMSPRETLEQACQVHSCDVDELVRMLDEHINGTDFMGEALKEAYEGIKNRHGGPFGSVIVKDGKIVGRGHNCVLLKHDSTCHGEMEAIRDACRTLETHDLSGCEIYTTAEPCPMCLGGILWSNIKKVTYGCNRGDTAEIGFRDDAFYECMQGDGDSLEMKEERRKECLELFEKYREDKGNQRY